MAIKSDKNDGIFNEINITPLTDIFLVLLIIMMFIAPMFQALDKNIKLPSVNSGKQVEEKEVTVAVTRDSKFFVNSAPVKDVKLTEKLKELLPEAKDKKVIVKADSRTKTKEIMKVLNAAKNAGYEKLTVVGEPFTQDQQKKLEKNDTNKDKTQKQKGIK